MHYINTTEIIIDSVRATIEDAKERIGISRLLAFLKHAGNGDTYYDGKTETMYSKADGIIYRMEENRRIAIGSRPDMLWRELSRATTERGLTPIEVVDEMVGRTQADLIAEKPGTTSHTMKLGFDLPPGAITAGPGLEGQGELTPQNAGIPWRCFHCDALFHNESDARAHFGASEVFAPICHLSPDDIRQMEQELMRYREEDTELHRHIADLEAGNAAELKSHGDTEYAKGIRDARLEGIEPIARETATQIIDAVMGAVDVLRSPMVKAQAWSELEAVGMAPGAISYQETIATKAAEILAGGNVMQLPRGHGKVKSYSGSEMAGAYMGGWSDAVEMAIKFIITQGPGVTPGVVAARLEAHNRGNDVQANAETYFEANGGPSR